MKEILDIIMERFIDGMSKIPAVVALANNLLSIIEKITNFMRKKERPVRPKTIATGIIGIIAFMAILGVSYIKNRETDDVLSSQIGDNRETIESISGWGDNGDYNNGHRPTYSLQQINEGILGDTITFNSIKLADTDADWYKETAGNDLPAGMLSNETNFVGARKDTGTNAGAGNVWEGTEITAEDGEIYIIRLFIHNNNPNGMNAIAEDTKVRFYIPYDSASEITVNGWLTATNARPGEYLDDVTFKSKDGTPFSLYYVSGSALLENGGCASGDGIVLPDSIPDQGETLFG